MKAALILTVTILIFGSSQAISANGEWGLRGDFLVADCKIKAVGPAEHFRGRSNQTNGSAAVIIWKIGTKRVVTWASATPNANDLIKDKMSFSYTLFADFTAYPMEKDIPGQRMPYCIEKVENPRWVYRKY